VYLREKEKQLRRKEKQLRDEKKQLREKEMFLLREEKQLRGEKNKLSGESHIVLLDTCSSLTWCSTEFTASPFAGAIYGGGAIINDRILRLPNNVHWVDTSIRGGSLFVRDCYKKLWDRVSDENQVTRRFSICGNPGIGKSWFLFYAMYRLGQEGKSMVYAHTIGRTNFFTVIAPPNNMQRSIPNEKMREVVRDSSVWYLVDGPVDAGELSAIPVNARVLQVTSPDRTKFKDFLKEGAEQYFMPVWTHDELEDCRGKMYPNVSAGNLKEFERIAGPIPRYVLEGSSTSPDKQRLP
jgi:hypothetical protein